MIVNTLLLFLVLYHAVSANPYPFPKPYFNPHSKHYSRLLNLRPEDLDSTSDLSNSEDYSKYSHTTIGFPNGREETDKDIDVLVTGQIVLNGFQNILAKAADPSDLSQYVEGFVTELKHVGISNKNDLSKLGYEYTKHLKERGYALEKNNRRLILSAFSLIGHIFLSEEYKPTRKNGSTSKNLDINMVGNKEHINLIVQAIKDGLQGVQAEDVKNINQNLNLNINIYTLLNLGMKLQQEKII